MCDSQLLFCLLLKMLLGKYLTYTIFEHTKQTFVVQHSKRLRGQVLPRDGLAQHAPNAVPAQVENHLPGAAALCGVLGGVKLAGAAISPEPAIATARRSACTATSYGR